jgi:hypothetical protein
LSVAPGGKTRSWAPYWVGAEHVGDAALDPDWHVDASFADLGKMYVKPGLCLLAGPGWDGAVPGEHMAAYVRLDVMLEGGLGRLRVHGDLSPPR